MSDPIRLPTPQQLHLAFVALANLARHHRITLVETYVSDPPSFTHVMRADVDGTVGYRETLCAAMTRIETEDWRGESGTLYREHRGMLGPWPLTVQEVIGHAPYPEDQLIDVETHQVTDPAPAVGRAVVQLDEHGAAEQAPAAAAEQAPTIVDTVPIVPDPRSKPRPYVMDALRQNAASSLYEESA